MRYLIYFFLIGIGATIIRESECDEKIIIVFADNKWKFPSTVGEAVESHGLDYRPPGYYFKVLEPNKVDVILFYNYSSGDMANEYQPKQTLYPKELNSYIFRFFEKEGLYDSLRTSLEKQYGGEFIREQRPEDSLYPNTPKFECDLMKISPCLSVAMKRNKDYEGRNKVVVRFMYRLSLKDMVLQMSSF